MKNQKMSKPQEDNLGAFFIFIMILLILGCSSCMTNRKGQLTEKGKNFIALHCKGEDSTSTKDKTVIVFDTIKVPEFVQGPIQYLENPCKLLCDSLGRLKVIDVKTKKNGIIGHIKTVGNSLAFDCNQDSLMRVIEKQIHTIETYEKNKTVIQKPCDQDHITGTQWYWIRTGQFLITFILLQILIRVFSGWIPFLRVLYVFKF